MMIKRLLSPFDYLWLAIALSLTIHGAFFYLFWPTNHSLRLSNEPEVALINYKNDEPVLEALLLAQWQSAGGGSGQPTNAASAPFSGQALPTPNELVLQALRERLRQAEQEQLQLLMQLESEWQHAQQESAKNQTETLHAAQETTHQNELAQKIHVLKAKIEHHNAQPRIHFDAPTTKASPYAAYIEAWRAKVERLGTEHYPEQAKGQLSDRLQMTVYIDNEGHLLKVDIHQPAHNPLFNVAAQRIIRLAAPFEAFSPEMKAEIDVLAITRSWHFTQGQLSTQLP